MTTAWLTIESTASEEELSAWTAEIQQGWIILESYTGIRFERWTGQQLTEGFAGRIFSKSTEIRWRRDAGVLQCWRFRETPGEGAKYALQERKYFAWGEWENGTCWEPRLPKPIAYPVQAASGRPYFVVLEYRRQWPEHWPADIGQIEEELNRPRLAAYRLADFQIQEADH